ncbi:Perlwapin-like protein [Mytilus coruscus]|uniref:Perlwapin-like protein n=1 Tax=Mytilus coruscus TaxID=42192 RepID=A0A6J8ACQ7_MYTCO|nr:Perlwapin-like protein [Mytilus coruscus]
MSLHKVTVFRFKFLGQQSNPRCVIDFDFHCAVQKQCPLGYRCCPNGCNKRCAAVTVNGKHLDISIAMTTVVQMNVYFILFLGFVAFIEVNCQDLGTCPKFDIFTACVIDFDFHCADQKQCPSGYRCCPHGCNKRCVAVTVNGNHLGSCSDASGTRGKTCTVDRSCEGHEKCCNGRCQTVRDQIVKVLFPVEN